MCERISTDISFFLGANTPGGFYSLFDELHDPEDGWRLYIIKGGPGTGKSSLMKKIAAEADRRGYYNERIYCSSDPDSLDGVIIPRLKISIADGTSPHVLEPSYPGAVEVILDLGAYRDDRRLYAERADILRLTKENKGLHDQCRRFLAAAGAGDEEIARLVSPYIRQEKLEDFCARFVSSHLGVTSGSGTLTRRFLTTLTPKGVYSFEATFEALCERRTILRDDYGPVSRCILQSFLRESLERGYDVLLCPSFLSPEGGIDALIVPELSFGVIADTPLHHTSLKGKAVCCDRFLEKDRMQEIRNRLTFAKKARREFLREAVKRQKLAKSIHDELEAHYVAAMDFSAVEQRAQTLLHEIFD